MKKRAFTLRGATSAVTATPSTVNITTTAITATATTAIIMITIANGYSTTVVTIAIAISITSTIRSVRPVTVTNTIIIAVTITYSANHSDSDNIQEHSNRATSKTILRFDSIHSSDGFCNKNISILLRLLSKFQLQYVKFHNISANVRLTLAHSVEKCTRSI
uniref:Uncharacterized protein n=1 Tax=Glossina palpalis gambiensis TaxID=67801 RepID=A0A1B0BGF1_9MUSC